MPAAKTMEFVFLLEDEIRLAARALAAVIEAIDAGNVSDDAMSDLVRDAIRAAGIALHGADREDAVLMMGSRRNLMEKGK